ITPLLFLIIMPSQ
ncbi:unnamed protein product, partial [Rhizophagus irregularis]